MRQKKKKKSSNAMKLYSATRSLFSKIDFVDMSEPEFFVDEADDY